MASNDGKVNNTESCENEQWSSLNTSDKTYDQDQLKQIKMAPIQGSFNFNLGQSDASSISDELVIHVSSREDIKLKQVNSAWTTRLVPENLSEEELRTQELSKKFRGILNKLTPQKFDILMKKVLQLEIDNQKRMECVIDILFEKALAKPYFSATYARMCLKLSSLRVPSDNNTDPTNKDLLLIRSTDHKISFRGLIINKCQTEFETGRTDEQLMQLEKELAATAEPAKKKELQIIINKEKRKIRLRAVSNARFIGELYKLKLLTYKIMDYCVRNLIDPLDEINLECLCELLTTIGKKAENDDGKTQLDSIFYIMQGIVKSKSNKISDRVKSIIQDTIDLRRRKWLVKSDVHSQRNMMDQIQNERERLLRSMEEKPNTNLKNNNVSIKDTPTDIQLSNIHKENITIQQCSSKESVNSKKRKHKTNLKNNNVSIKNTPTDIELSNIHKENITIQQCLSKESVNSEKVKNMCVRLVTIHGRSFAMIEDAAFQEILNIAVPSNAISKEINSNFIKAMIPEKAYQIRSKIGAEVRNKMVSLILGSATYADRNFLGLNLQYIENGKIIIRNLAVLEVMERQTGESLKEKILEVLTNFTIASSQIYSITTDIGSNHFKMVTKLINKNCCETRVVDDICEGCSCDENEHSIDEDHIDFAEDELNFENVASALSNGEFKPRAIFCVAHSLQIAVKDAIGHSQTVQMTINTARQAVMVLRRPNWKNILISSNLKKPILDCPTRWTSTYQMLVRLYSFKGIFSEHHELSIYSEEFWKEIVDIITCLKPLNEATVALQREQLTTSISDFYIEWLSCRTKVEAIHTTFAGDLIKFMNKRERNFMDKGCVLESLYLDGRVHIMLSNQECVKAKSLLCQTFRQLETIASSEAGASKMNIPSTSHDDQHDTHNITDLERMLQQTEKMRRLPQSVTENQFEDSLNKLRFKPRLPLSKDILAHWHSKDASLISLQKVANCVLAAPATHVSVERLFESVKLIPRTDIIGNLLQDIMLIRANPDLFD